MSKLVQCNFPRKTSLRERLNLNSKRQGDIPFTKSRIPGCPYVMVHYVCEINDIDTGPCMALTTDYVTIRGCVRRDI